MQIIKRSMKIKNKILCSLMLFFLIAGLNVDLHAQDPGKSYVETIPGTNLKIKMIPIPGGKYNLRIGNKEFSVTLSPYWIASHELTHDIFSAFDQDESLSRDVTVDAITRPSPQYVDLTWGMGREGGFPANSMSLYSAIMVSKWLYDKTGHFYRPPTEAEWQAACIAGGNDDENLRKIALFKENSGDKYHKIGSRAPDKLGLYDMLGNVAEWTVDAYEEDYQKILDQSSDKDPHLVPESRRTVVTLKGGHYETPAKELSCDLRIKSEKWWNQRDPQIPKSRWWYTDAPFTGIRLVRPVDQPSKADIEAYYDKFLN